MLFQGNGNINATITFDTHVMVGWGQTLDALLVLLRPFLAQMTLTKSASSKGIGTAAGTSELELN